MRKHKTFTRRPFYMNLYDMIHAEVYDFYTKVHPNPISLNCQWSKNMWTNSLYKFMKHKIVANFHDVALEDSFITNSAHSKPVWLTFSCRTQKRIFWKFIFQKIFWKRVFYFFFMHWKSVGSNVFLCSRNEKKKVLQA